MQFSYNFLKKYVKDIPTVDILAEEIGLTSFELDGVVEIDVNGQKDYLIDWDILPNRSSDCLCYMGVAKEIASVFDLEFSSIIPNFKGDMQIKTSNFLSLEIETPALVKRATKRIAVDVRVGESPQWLKNILESLGQKSINNVVDITNYVMWVTGQPVHAFDYDKLSGDDDFKKMSIKFANGDEIQDLSGEKHVLDKSILVIHDGEQALDIAGIKGGRVSEVDYETKRLILSVVNFDFQNIRITSKKLKLQTDASKRFENEVPLNKTDWAMSLMSDLLVNLTGAQVADEFIDTQPKLESPKIISLGFKNINAVLGFIITKKEINNIFKRLDFKVKEEKEILSVTVPFERLDLNIPEDIIEEIGRLYGYKNIKAKFPEEAFRIPKPNKVKLSKDNIVDTLTLLGFYEVLNRTIVEYGTVVLKNPLNSKAISLRDNLLDQIKNRIEKNLIYSDEPKLFEVGKVFAGYENDKEDRVVNEFFSFAGMIGRKKIKEIQKEDLFYQTKGYLEKIFEVLSIGNVSWEDSEDREFIADIYCADVKVGGVGINFWEVNLEKLIKHTDKSIEYKRVSKYPKIMRDVALWTSLDTKKESVESIIIKALPKEATNVELFDIYKDIENNRKSFAFGINFQSYTETLSDIFANKAMDKVYKTLQEKGFETR